ncbi:hypothetical protein CRYUN_Cryun05aG0234400 [Craigia yunnanensis]
MEGNLVILLTLLPADDYCGIQRTMVNLVNQYSLYRKEQWRFVYLIDSLLSTVDGVEILTQVKQLYLAGNEITSLVSLPQFPNLELPSVAQNKLKSLSVASQPRLQVRFLFGFLLIIAFKCWCRAVWQYDVDFPSDSPIDVDVMLHTVMHILLVPFCCCLISYSDNAALSRLVPTILELYKKDQDFALIATYSLYNLLNASLLSKTGPHFLDFEISVQSGTTLSREMRMKIARDAARGLAYLLGSSRVQWFKTNSLTLNGENDLEAMSMSKVAKVGVDNMCILLHDVKQQPLELPLEERISNALVEVDLSITLSSLSEFFSFSVGGFTHMPTCSVFSLFAVFDCLNAEDNRIDCFPCIKIHSSAGESNEGMNSRGAGLLARYMQEMHAPFLGLCGVKLVVIAVFVAFASASIAVSTRIVSGLEQQIVLRQDSYLQGYFTYDSEFLRIGPPLYFVVKDYNCRSFLNSAFELLLRIWVASQDLKQLYLAGNEITSLVSLPQFPNLEWQVDLDYSFQVWCHAVWQYNIDFPSDSPIDGDVMADGWSYYPHIIIGSFIKTCPYYIGVVRLKFSPQCSKYKLHCCSLYKKNQDIALIATYSLNNLLNASLLSKTGPHFLDFESSQLLSTLVLVICMNNDSKEHSDFSVGLKTYNEVQRCFLTVGSVYPEDFFSSEFDCGYGFTLLLGWAIRRVVCQISSHSLASFLGLILVRYADALQSYADLDLLMVSVYAATQVCRCVAEFCRPRSSYNNNMLDDCKAAGDIPNPEELFARLVVLLHNPLAREQLATQILTVLSFGTSVS